MTMPRDQITKGKESNFKFENMPQENSSTDSLINLTLFNQQRRSTWTNIETDRSGLSPTFLVLGLHFVDKQLGINRSILRKASELKIDNNFEIKLSLCTELSESNHHQISNK